ncbi:elongation of very long chain fatty acids protein-like [Ischnura elegans]|uniref:elongation of very long chain fatty acids protein-like n=1 Tax=Ischnura elegans TaxID=197161 RepID=UPI001ED882C3|nr:elongation of very long chain fatty acids protein-like [Ischnura elegans]
MASGMAAGFIRSYRELMEKADDRVEDWFLMSSPLPLACIIATYIWFVKYAGPKWMENKEPYDLRRFLQFYNVFQVCFNGWLFYEAWLQYNSSLILNVARS